MHTYIDGLFDVKPRKRVSIAVNQIGELDGHKERFRVVLSYFGLAAMVVLSTLAYYGKQTVRFSYKALGSFFGFLFYTVITTVIVSGLALIGAVILDAVYRSLMREVEDNVALAITVMIGAGLLYAGWRFVTWAYASAHSLRADTEAEIEMSAEDIITRLEDGEPEDDEPDTDAADEEPETVEAEKVEAEVV